MAKRSEVERKIYFYRIDVGRKESGEPVVPDLSKGLQKIHELPFTDGKNYWDLGDGDVLCSRVDSVVKPHRLRFGRVRRSALPQVENAGEVTPLDLPKTAGLVEWVHVLFLPGNVVGAEFNFFGPRIAALTSYLRRRGGNSFSGLRLHPLMRHDILGRVEKLQQIREFRLAVRTSYAEQVREADSSLADALDATKKIGDADWVEIVLHPRRDSLSDKVKSVIGNLVKSDSLREEAFRFKVTAREPSTDRPHVIDLLADELIATRRVARPAGRSRALDPDSVYAAIESAYEELKGEIQKAAEADVSQSQTR